MGGKNKRDHLAAALPDDEIAAFSCSRKLKTLYFHNLVINKSHYDAVSRN